MDETWDVRLGLTCLLDALSHTELDTDPHLDLMEPAALLAQVAERRQPPAMEGARPAALIA
jgi:hypothetical protein